VTLAHAKPAVHEDAHAVVDPELAAYVPASHGAGVEEPAGQ